MAWALSRAGVVMHPIDPADGRFFQAAQRIQAPGSGTGNLSPAGKFEMFLQKIERWAIFDSLGARFAGEIAQPEAVADAQSFVQQFDLADLRGRPLGLQTSPLWPMSSTMNGRGAISAVISA